MEADGTNITVVLMMPSKKLQVLTNGVMIFVQSLQENNVNPLANVGKHLLITTIQQLHINVVTQLLDFGINIGLISVEIIVFKDLEKDVVLLMINHQTHGLVKTDVNDSYFEFMIYFFYD